MLQFRNLNNYLGSSVSNQKCFVEHTTSSQQYYLLIQEEISDPKKGLYHRDYEGLGDKITMKWLGPC